MTDDNLDDTQQSVGITPNERLIQSMSVEQISKFGGCNEKAYSSIWNYVRKYH